MFDLFREIPGLQKVDPSAIAKFSNEMEAAIPLIVRDVRNRISLAEISRRRVLCTIEMADQP